MKALSQCKPCRGLMAWGKKLSSLKLRGSYQMDLSLYGEEAEGTALCTHRCDGSVSYSLWRLLAILGALVLGMAMLRALCGLLSRLSD